MDEGSLAQLVDQINHQTHSQELLNQRLLEAEALTQILMTIDFLTLSKSTMYHYLGILNEAVIQSRKINETTLDALLELKSFTLKTNVAS